MTLILKFLEDRSRVKIVVTLQATFSDVFLERKIMRIRSNLNEIWANLQWVVTRSGNVLAPNMCQAVTWINEIQD